MKFKELYNKVRREQGASLDEDAMWDVIESRLEKPKKKRRFIWLWFAAGIFMLSGYYLINHDTTEISTQKHLSENNNYEEINPVNTQAMLTPSKLETVTQDSDEKGESTSANDYDATGDVRITKQEVDTDGEDDNYSIESRNRVNPLQQNSDIPDKDNTRAISGKQAAITDELKRQYSENQKIEQKQSEIHKRIDLNDNPYNKYEANQGYDESRFDDKDINNHLYTEAKESEEVDENRRLLLLLTPVPLISISKIIYDRPHLISSPLISIMSSSSDNAITYNEEGNGSRFEFAVTLGYLQQYSTVTEKDPNIFTWGALHDESKSAVTSYQLATILKYRSKWGVGVGAGVITRSISEWYDGVVETESPYEEPSDSAKFTTVNGLQQYAPGILTGTLVERTRYHTPVRRIYIDIPIEVSYSRSWSKMDIELSASYNFNSFHQYYGRSYAEDKVLLTQSQLRSQEVYKSKSVNSSNVGLKLNRHITSSLSVGLSLSYWRQLSSSLAERGSLTERYTGIGGGLNIRKTLGR